MEATRIELILRVRKVSSLSLCLSSSDAFIKSLLARAENICYFREVLSRARGTFDESFKSGTVVEFVNKILEGKLRVV